MDNGSMGQKSIRVRIEIGGVQIHDGLPMDSGKINCFISHENTFYSVLNMCTAIDLSVGMLQFKQRPCRRIEAGRLEGQRHRRPTVKHTFVLHWMEIYSTDRYMYNTTKLKYI